jgi:hypothetical protein
MNDIEDIVRAAITATAAKVNQKDLGPLQLDAPTELFGAGESGRVFGAAKTRPRRLVAALGAAAAVLALIVGSFTVASVLLHHRAAKGPTHHLGTHVGVPRYLVGVPRYFAELGGSKRGDAIIVDAQTGKVIATISPPKSYYNFVGVTAAADDRTFVLAATTGISTSGISTPEKLYVLRFTLAHGKASTTLRQLRIGLPAGWTPEGLALSPDATQLAIADAPSAASPVEVRVYVYALATGAVKIWSASGQIGNEWDTLPFDAKTFSWAPDDRTLAYFFYAYQKRRLGNAGIYLLDSRSPGGSLLSHSRRLISIRADGYGRTGDWDLTPDGTRIEVGENKYQDKHFVYDCRIKVYSALTGRLIAVRNLPEHIATLGGVLWAGPRAQIMVVALYGGAGSDIPVQVLRGDRLFPIRGVSGAGGSAW